MELDTKIIEGNKLIAEFIGLSPHNLFPEELSAPFGFEWMAVYINTSFSMDKEIENEMEFHKYFRFHSSWDWLMPVVEKIGGTDWASVDIHWGSGATDSFAWCDISWNNSKVDFDTSNKLNSDEQSLIKATWLAVIEFIKWYNKNIKK